MVDKLINHFSLGHYTVNNFADLLCGDGAFNEFLELLAGGNNYGSGNGALP